MVGLKISKLERKFKSAVVYYEFLRHNKAAPADAPKARAAERQRYV